MSTAALLSFLAIAFFAVGHGAEGRRNVEQGTHASITLVTREYLRQRLQTAQAVDVAAFVLNPGSSIVRDLDETADRGAHVSVHLSRGFGMYISENLMAANILAAHGVAIDVRGRSSRPFHLKAMIVDGDLFLSDRNWANDQTQEIIVKDTASIDAEIVRRSIDGETRSNDHLWMTKHDALQAEALMLDRSNAMTVRASSESFGGRTALVAALRRKANDGAVVEFMIAESEFRRSASERALAHGLQAAGIRVRLSDANEKFAIVGDDVWIGSANATGGVPNQIDFGLVANDPDILSSLSNHFDREWQQGRDIP